jgi:hypothetical protein
MDDPGRVVDCLYSLFSILLKLYKISKGGAEE